MAEFTLPYGHGSLTLSLPDEVRSVRFAWQVEYLAPKQVATLPNPSLALNRALENALGERGLSNFAGPKSAAIAVNDKTRPVPNDVLLPPLLRRLEALGLRSEAITLLIASGSHPPMSPDEFEKVLPADIIRRYRVLSHDASYQQDLIYLGKTRRGTPTWINRHFAQADLRIVVGNLEPHQFMGFSGGVKSAAIGLAGVETINCNHAMMSDDRAQLGRFHDNPARQDVEEIGGLIGVHLAVNVVLNEAKEIVDVVVGEPETVMRTGIPQVRKLYQLEVSAPYDLMVVSPGGYPKDINLYQSQKGLAHAASIVKDGGTVILVAACPEGTGSHSYEQWIDGMTSNEAVLQRFKREGFRIGPHKAFQIARDASRVRVLLVSQMSPGLVKRLLLTPVSSLDEAMSLALDTLAPGGRIPSPGLRVGVMPWANAIIPVLRGE